MKVLICGGGNGAHVLAGLATVQADLEVAVLTLYADEAERWNKEVEKQEFTVKVHHANNTIEDIKCKPKICKDASSVAPGSDLIILCVPAFAHDQYLKTLLPYVTPGCVLVGLPGQAGFEFSVRGIWGKLSEQCTLLNTETLPWACRIQEFGKVVEVLGTKDILKGASRVGTKKPAMEPDAMLQKVLGELPRVQLAGDVLGVTLMALNAAAHPSIMYGQWHDWDGKNVDTPPLFYHGLSEFSAKLMSDVSQEMVDTAVAISKIHPEINLDQVCHIHPWLASTYPKQISDDSSLLSCFRTNSSYASLTHPMTKDEKGNNVPDFQTRYLLEDIPYGLVVLRGIAELVGMNTPNIDLVLKWSQEKIGHEYLVDGKLKGKDLPRSRCPQAYGLTKLDQII